MTKKNKNAGKPSIDEFIEEYPSTLFVTDPSGNILISNEFTALTIGIHLEELLKANVQDLVKAGYYGHSITMEAIETKQKVSRTVNTSRGFHVFSSAIPILDKDGEVQLVVTTSNEFSQDHTYAEASGPVARQTRKQLGDPAAEKKKGIVAESLAMKQIIKVCNQIASYDSKVLIYGESGTGKEVIAKYIHLKSEKWKGPFIAINCAAIAPALFEYELFGYEKGVLEGQTEVKTGMIEIANGGVLFLDEIADLPLEMQAKLLRVLENNEVRRVGGITNIPVNCRIISATNRDLWSLVKKGLFREDLYYRINVIPIHIPPLRNRKLDLVGLISSFIASFNQMYGKKYVLSAEEFDQMLNQPWHGNVRELRNYIERLVVTEQVGPSQPEEDPIGDWFSLDHFIEKNIQQLSSLKDFTAVAEGHYIKKVLKDCSGNGTEAAKKLSVDRSVIYRKLKKMDEVLRN
ncbi:sigma 54-interacting transcriptional regulator [Paenibacillus tritici]|uniref:Sigma 54-interacting transcriptional regulator n=1 Tax=Paenibacillus tritici TaxID=1873425 RepID=A0ABX2DKK0_9BACL|nr:sigma 54-interacting transcriptional regulator [Paenibacillus tritici]NQX44356.1 sigma 54-interacting transcriptional regulator [Paenibacillus tritici]QUL53296.1 sigma 54-interacting transcriptional regulator [Paenibacillus tritici]